MQRSNAESKQFKQRKAGLMKKANELYKLCGVRVAVIIQDREDWYSYRSQRSWPAGTDIEYGDTMVPDDFITLREAGYEIDLSIPLDIRQETPAENDLAAHSALRNEMQLAEDETAGPSIDWDDLNTVEAFRSFQDDDWNPPIMHNECLHRKPTSPSIVPILQALDVPRAYYPQVNYRQVISGYQGQCGVGEVHVFSIQHILIRGHRYRKVTESRYT
ncbi:MAG: hypothetical protein M1818_003029 [Claussenomyces sp. TS43310]|nr:MAG: hypothetical protein M1818_003029 [Claussenomyces sp. TS43310]